MLDCATIYTNEALVGQAINRVVTESDSGVAREDLFVITKLWMDMFKDPEAALRASLEKLQVSYVDCYMIHWPAGFFQDDPANRVPMHVLWPKLEALVDQGLAKSIGVSNFSLQMLADNMSLRILHVIVFAVCSTGASTSVLNINFLESYMMMYKLKFPLFILHPSDLDTFYEEMANTSLSSASFSCFCYEEGKKTFKFK